MDELTLFELRRLSEGSASEFTSILEEGEKVVLWPAGINGSSHQSLLLTNRRLVKFEKKGLFKPRYSKTGEYSIGQITEAHANMKGTACHLVARLNDGKEWQCMLNVPSTTVGVDATMATRLATTNRWANAINMLIQNRT